MSAETKAVTGHHLQSVGKGDLDAILSDYTEDSVMIDQKGIVKGGWRPYARGSKRSRRACPPTP